MARAAYLELSFQPNDALVSVVRRLVSEFYQQFLMDPEGTSRVALATHELLENAVKYAKDGETALRIEVEPSTPRTVRIVLRNRAEPAHIAAMCTIVDSIGRATDAFSFYQQLIAQQATARPGSGLGLARICAEGEMTIRYEIAGDQATVEATTLVSV